MSGQCDNDLLDYWQDSPFALFAKQPTSTGCGGYEPDAVQSKQVEE